MCLHLLLLGTIWATLATSCSVLSDAKCSHSVPLYLQCLLLVDSCSLARLHWQDFRTTSSA